MDMMPDEPAPEPRLSLRDGARLFAGAWAAGFVFFLVILG